MTVQIEQSPRQGVELDQAWTWRDYLAMALSYALTAGVAFALFFPDPAVIFGVTFFGCLVLIAAFVVSAACEKGAHL